MAVSKEFDYNREIFIGSWTVVGIAQVDISMIISFEKRNIVNSDWNINVSLDQSGKLSVGCQDQIIEASRDIDFGGLIKDTEFSEALSEMALAIKFGNITLGTEPMGEKKLKMYIIGSTDNLEPDDEDVEKTISLELDFVITLKDGSGDKFDTEAFAAAVGKVLIGVAAVAIICLVASSGAGALIGFLESAGFLVVVSGGI